MRAPRDRANFMIGAKHTRQFICLVFALVGLTSWITQSGYLISVTGARPDPGFSLLSHIAVSANPRALPLATFTVTNINDSGSGSLRDAINLANADSVMDTINFNITSGCHPTTGVCTITPTSPLPAIIQPVVIDGYTQPGASENTLSVGDNAVLLIELNGINAGNTNGFTVTAGICTFRGLVINRFQGSGIEILGGFGGHK
ncbi:MAG TPA: hypothetical protein VJ180_12100, partial [Pyrinomonadaceae bacterium]|nr:hypothetical protein [Pyrinomonadaceae bacterium]